MTDWCEMFIISLKKYEQVNYMQADFFVGIYWGTYIK